MKFSIVTISYNQAQFLEEAILSVLNQEGVDIEYIVVDPGSTDGSREIIERYRDRIARVIFEPDHGPADGLNKGFALATGDVYGFLNSDDVFRPGALAKAARYFERHPHIDVVSAHAHLIDERGALLHRVFSRRFSVYGYLARGLVIIQQSTFCSAAAYRRTDGFNVLNRTCWDGELWVDLAVAGVKFGMAHDFWSGYRVHGNSITGTMVRDGYRDIYAEDFDRMRRRLHCRAEVPARIAQLIRIESWLRDPVVLMLRLGDGLIHPNRVL